MMTLEREKLMLTELRDMAALDKSAIADKYQISVDAADIYRMTKTVAVLDTVIDSLDEAIIWQQQEAQKAAAKK